MKSLKEIVVNEARSDAVEKDVIRNLDNVLANDLRNRYYGVGDHISELVRLLNTVNGETGEFGADLKYAKAALKAFDKMTLGRIV